MSRFPPACRLRKPAEFATVYRSGRRLNRGPLRVVWRRNDLDTARLGLAIARRPLKSAVVRNRIKRLCRESFRLNSHRLPAVDIAISLNSRDRAPYDEAELRKALDAVWACLIDRCAPSSSA